MQGQLASEAAVDASEPTDETSEPTDASEGAGERSAADVLLEHSGRVSNGVDPIAAQFFTDRARGRQSKVCSF